MDIAHKLNHAIGILKKYEPNGFRQYNITIIGIYRPAIGKTGAAEIQESIQ